MVVCETTNLNVMLFNNELYISDWCMSKTPLNWESYLVVPLGWEEIHGKKRIYFDFLVFLWYILDWIHFKQMFLKLNTLFRMVNNFEWLTLSNAALRSSKTKNEICCLSMLHNILIVIFFDNISALKFVLYAEYKLLLILLLM